MGNVERQEIEMTTPVLSTLTPTEDGMMKNKMCFYLDSSAQDNPPTPETSDVFIERNKPLIVAVYEFGGYAMTDDVWEAEAAIFAQRLGDRVNSVGHQQLLHRRIRQSHEVLEQEERGHVQSHQLRSSSNSSIEVKINQLRSCTNSSIDLSIKNSIAHINFE